MSQESKFIAKLPPAHEPAPGLIQLKVEVENVNYHNEENGWTVLRVKDLAETRSHFAVGYFPSIYAGEYYLLFGTWGFHKTFGKQFKIERAVASRPQSREGICRYLGSGLFRGIGSKTAEKIVKHLGLNTFNVLDEDPEQLKLIPTLGRKTASKVLKAWREKQQVNHVLMFLYQHGITASKAQKLLQLYGNDAQSCIAENPYALMKVIRGVGFLTADRIAHSVGLAKDHPQRIQAAILYLLSQAEDQGHCYLNTAQLCERMSKTLQLPWATCQELVVPQLHTLQNELRVISRPAPSPAAPTATPAATESEDTSLACYFHYSYDLYWCEDQVAKAVCSLLKSPLAHDQSSLPALEQRIRSWLDHYTEKSGTQLSQQQRSATLLAALSKVFILTGGPGVGKTTTANTIIRLFRAMGKSVALAAPTGRAAQRLSEVSAESAKTIHRLLEWSAQDNCFKRDRTNKLTASVVIIDEASMLDVRLADSLLAAVPSSAQLIFIGDSDQLPSVGPGNVLRDLIASELVPCFKLSQIFRQAETSQIIQSAHAINAGKMPEFSDATDSDCRFITAASVAEIPAVIADLLKIHLPAAGYDPIKDVQVLTPMHKGEIGCQQLNTNMQQWLNPLSPGAREKQVKSLQLRQHDKVIQNVNNYDLAVFNGDIGYIEMSQVEGGQILVHFNGRQVSYDTEQLQDLNLAYAITIHKSQGSEFPVVIIPLSVAHYVMLQKNLIYTALTRAKKLAIFVGEKKALSLAIKNMTSATRQTCLNPFLQREMKA